MNSSQGQLQLKTARGFLLICCFQFILGGELHCISQLGHGTRNSCLFPCLPSSSDNLQVSTQTSISSRRDGNTLLMTPNRAFEGQVLCIGNRYFKV